jgi:hypothetical protein
VTRLEICALAAVLAVTGILTVLMAPHEAKLGAIRAPKLSRVSASGSPAPRSG